jgi:type IV secretory pathway TrbD component
MDYQPRYNIIHGSLLSVKMLAGVEVRIAVPLWAVVLAFVLVFHYFFVLPIGILMHLFLVWLFKQDDRVVDVYRAYSKQADVYDPWPRVDSETKRPAGFGRDMLC